MSPDNSTVENVAFNPVNLEIVLLSEVVDPDENLFNKSLADLDTKYFFPEMLPDYFENTDNRYLTFEYSKFAEIFQ